MGDLKLGNYMDSLLNNSGGEVYKYDYGVLFPTSSGYSDYERRNCADEDIVSRISASTPSIDEDIKVYYDDDDDDHNVSNRAPSMITPNKLVGIDMNNEKSRRNCEADESIVEMKNEELLLEEWKSALQPPTSIIDASKIDELFKLEEKFFSMVIKSTSDSLSLSSLEKLIFYVWKFPNVVSKSKLKQLAEHGLLPKLLASESPLRTVFPIFQKFVATDSIIATELVLFPMVQKKILIPRPLLKGIDKQHLLSLTLRWMEAGSIEPSQEYINILNQLLEGQRKLEDCHIEGITRILSQAFTLRPSDKALAFFFRTFVDSVHPVLNSQHLQALKSLNRFNQTDLKGSIELLLDKALESYDVIP